jgi:hypothetical protein
LAAIWQTQAANGGDSESIASKPPVVATEHKLKKHSNRVTSDTAVAKTKEKARVNRSDASIAATASDTPRITTGVKDFSLRPRPSAGSASQPVADDSTEMNGGRDIIRPEHRLDIFLNSSGSSDGSRSGTTTLRYERPFALEDAWKIAFRVEAPFVMVNDSGSFSSGYGDTLFQAVLSKELDARQGFAVGLRFIAPTATGDEFGNGRWRMLPVVGYRYGLPEISRDTYLQFVARYAFDFAGDDSRNHTSQLQMSPSFNVGLPEQWYVTLFPSTDVRYDFINREWFVPFNLEVGKVWGKSFLTGLEIGVPFFETAHPVYKYKIEAHIGFRF